MSKNEKTMKTVVDMTGVLNKAFFFSCLREDPVSLAYT
jgi:hypothetical protein